MTVIVAVTGAHGFVGRALCQHLKACGFSVRAITRSASGEEDTWAVGDLGPGTDWGQSLQGVDCVVHCAARVHMVQDTDPDPLQSYRRVNVEGSRSLAIAAAAPLIIATINILWGNAATTLDATIFGWPQTDTAGTGATLTAPNLGRGLWRPGKPISEPDSRRRRVHLGGIAESLSGQYRVSNFGESVRQRELAFRLLQRSVALDEYATATEPYGTWEQAWESMRLGRPARLYADEATRTSTSYSLVRTRSLTDPLARDPSTPLRWGVDLQVADV